MMLGFSFFNRDALTVARDLMGKIIRIRRGSLWLSMQIIETEAYYKRDKASHSSLGYTEKRKALFMSAGTIYMYYARGADSLNISCRGSGNAVLIKAGVPDVKHPDSEAAVWMMQQLNPTRNNAPRSLFRLGSGQTLLCKSLGLRVLDWNQKQFDPRQFFIDCVGVVPKKIIQTTRLGIPLERDEHLWYRFVDLSYAVYCTKNPLTQRKGNHAQNYRIVEVKKIKTGQGYCSFVV